MIKNLSENRKSNSYVFSLLFKSSSMCIPEIFLILKKKKKKVLPYEYFIYFGQ